jgi:hypothetical protein
LRDLAVASLLRLKFLHQSKLSLVLPGTLSQPILAEGTMIRKIQVEDLSWSRIKQPHRVFVAYGKGDLRKSRRRLQMV